MSNTPPLPDHIECLVYRASRRADTYVFVRKEDGETRLPDALRTLTGRLELAMEVTLGADRKLARADTGEVMRAIVEKGFYLQMPPPETPR